MGDIITIFRIGGYIKRSRTFDFEIYETKGRSAITWEQEWRLLPKNFNADCIYEQLKKGIENISLGYTSCLFIELKEIGEEELCGETVKVVDITVESI